MVEPKKGMQLQLLIMIGMVVGVMIVGYLALPKSEQERDALLSSLGTTNHGNLISPLLPVSEIALWDDAGQLWEHPLEKAKWRLLILGDAECLGDCREMVYATRQVHLRLGKRSQRFERLYVATAEQLSPQFSEYLQGHPYLKVLHVDVDEWRAWLARSGLAYPGEALALLVDQGGNAMMYYGADIQGGEMLEDLNHLLKYSPGK